MADTTDRIVEALHELANGARTVYTPHAQQVAAAARATAVRSRAQPIRAADLDEVEGAVERLVIMLVEKVTTDALELAREISGDAAEDDEG